MKDNHLKKLTKLSHDEWEAICQRCGRCCYEKLDDCGEIIYTCTPCDRFDPDTRLCTVYEDRHVKRPDCLPLSPEVVAAGFLPADCPYVIGIVNYKAPELKSGNSS